jgi:hypothetical protein
MTEMLGETPPRSVIAHASIAGPTAPWNTRPNEFLP